MFFVELLLLVAFVAIGIYAWSKMSGNGTGGDTEQPSTPPAAAGSAPAPVFERFETVTVSRPEEMAEAIARVRRDRTNNLIGTNYVLGTPQVSADGLTANVPLYRQD